MDSRCQCTVVKSIKPGLLTHLRHDPFFISKKAISAIVNETIAGCIPPFDTWDGVAHILNKINFTPYNGSSLHVVK